MTEFTAVRVVDAPADPTPPIDPHQPRPVHLGEFHPDGASIELTDARGERALLIGHGAVLLEIDELLGDVPEAALWATSFAAVRRELILSGGGLCIAFLNRMRNGGAPWTLFRRNGKKAWHSFVWSDRAELIAAAAQALAGRSENRAASQSTRWMVRVAPGLKQRRRAGVLFEESNNTILDAAELPNEILDDRYLLVSREPEPDEAAASAA